MKAFWWFKENSIAGMGRPGFNKMNWSNLTFEEDLVLGWFGNQSSGTETLESLRKHIRSHGIRLLKVHNIKEEQLAEIVRDFESETKIFKAIKKVVAKTNCLEKFQIQDNNLTFTLSSDHLNQELDYLKSQKISRVVALTEKHHQKEFLESHFDLYHLAIADLAAPQMDQVLALAELIKDSKKKQLRMAVHCMAGVGRTSTMLVAAHLFLGEDLESLKSLLKKQNPAFKLTTAQMEFLNSVSNK